MASKLDRDPYEDCPSDCEVILPGNRELFVDLDDDKILNDDALASLIKNGYEIRFVKQSVSRNGGHHAYLEAPEELEPLERVLLQACLGSDPVREILSFLRIKRGHKTPTTFFERRQLCRSN